MKIWVWLQRHNPMTEYMKFPILRSGYIGMSNNGLQLPVIHDTRTDAVLSRKEQMLENPKYYYHTNIQRLFEKLLGENQEGFLNRIVVQEEILKTAKQAFHTPSLAVFIQHQTNSPTYTPLHQRFLLETLEFISGTPRKAQVQTWIKLLTARAPVGQSPDLREGLYQKQMFEVFAQRRVPVTLHEAVLQWIIQEGGLYDFMITLEVIFGNRRILVP